MIRDLRFAPTSIEDHIPGLFFFGDLDEVLRPVEVVKNLVLRM
jgi:hypothetical protein